MQSRKIIIEALDVKVQQARLVQGQSTTMVAVEEVVPVHTYGCFQARKYQSMDI
jgi:hypothetical protein